MSKKGSVVEVTNSKGASAEGRVTKSSPGPLDSPLSKGGRNTTVETPGGSTFTGREPSKK